MPSKSHLNASKSCKSSVNLSGPLNITFTFTSHSRYSSLVRHAMLLKERCVTIQQRGCRGELGLGIAKKPCGFKMALLFRRTAFMTSVFRSSTPSLLQSLRSFTAQNIEKKVLPTSNLSEKWKKAGKDKQRQTAKGQDMCSPSINARQIHVGNLFNITEDALFKHFSRYGEVARIEFIRTRFSKLPRGFAFVTFSDVESAQSVLTENHVINGEDITVGLPLKEKNANDKLKKDLTVLVTNVLANTSKEAVKEHFSQFGKVDKVVLAQKVDENFSSYYVIFLSLSGAKKALEEPAQKIAEQDIDSQVMEFPKTKEFTGETKRLFLTSVPDCVTVDDLRDYFQKFGDVEYIELFIHTSSVAEKNCNVAYVHFLNKSTVEEIVESNNHVINGSKVTVSKQGILQDNRDGSHRLKVSVEGFPLSAKLKDVKKCFKDTFRIVPSFVCFKRDHVIDTGKVVCIVKFLKESELEMVLKKTDVTFGGAPLYFRQLVWSNKGWRVDSSD